MATIRARRRPGDVRIETQTPLTRRSSRQPRYEFAAASLPRGRLIPLAFAPVLAGDTVKGSSLMARVMADPVPNYDIEAVMGQWFESWLFYVRIGDLPSAETIRSIIIDPSFTASPIDWRDECLQAIWNAYFTDENVAGVATPPFVPAVTAVNTENILAIPGNGWWDSVTQNAELPDVTEAAGDEWQEQWIRYQALRRAKLTTTTWEEYLAKSGVSVPPQLRVEHDAEMKIPELLKWTREFAYPQPGGFSSGDDPVVELFRTQWFIQQRLERSRFCAEPGFLVSCIAVRPKVYRIYDRTVFDPLEVLDDAQGWLPIDMDTDPHSSLVSIPSAVFGDTAPGAESTFDIRDLFLYGDNEAVDLEASRRTQPLSFADRYEADLGQPFTIDAQIRHTFASRIGTDTTAG